MSAFSRPNPRPESWREIIPTERCSPYLHPIDSLADDDLRSLVTLQPSPYPWRLALFPDPARNLDEMGVEETAASAVRAYSVDNSFGPRSIPRFYPMLEYQ
jgi:predicted hotdog family 3-hydroxylacyl-ACP dehydratase